MAYGGLFSYVKVSIAGWCLHRSERALFWCGALTQVRKDKAKAGI